MNYKNIIKSQTLRRKILRMLSFIPDKPVFLGGYSYRLIITQKEPINHGLIDYKFFYFNGKTKFLYVMGDRKVGERVKVRLMDRDFKRLPVSRIGDANIEEVSEPKNY